MVDGLEKEGAIVEMPAWESDSAPGPTCKDEGTGGRAEIPLEEELGGMEVIPGSW
jgi:hypothetical protein